MANKQRVLYFIGTQYKGKPIFTVRGNTYQPNGIGDAISVNEKDVADLLAKSQVYGLDGRTYQGFTADPHVAAAIKTQVDKGNKLAGVPVDATLAEQLRIAAPISSQNIDLGDIDLEALQEFLTKKKVAPATKSNKGANKEAEVAVEATEEKVEN